MFNSKLLRKRSIIRLTVAGLAIAFTCSALVLLFQSMKTNNANAVSKANWQAGNIISDAIFTNNNAMSVNEIQAFLDKNIGTCDIWGKGIASEWGSNLTRAQYAESRGWPAPPYVCLNKYMEVPKTSPSRTAPKNNINKNLTTPTGARSAAWIIRDAANRYKISPKVLLVKIATESSGPLTSDNWPLASQYTYAMGSHCPDSGPGGSPNCDPNYAGFSIQIYSAASLMRSYLDDMDQPWWSYKKPGNNTILWNVVEATYKSGTSWKPCGGSTVNIKNKATAALYTYTPYQPNDAALNYMYGKVPASTSFGSRCAAYGNRNFWSTFSDWFGNPQDDFIVKSEDLVGTNGIIKNTAISVGSPVETLSISNKIYTFYTDTTKKTLRLAYWNGSKWSDSIIDGKGASLHGALNTSLSINSIASFVHNNTVQLYYTDTVSGIIRHVYQKNGEFRIETLDGTSKSILGKNRNVGTTITALSRGGSEIQLFYQNTDTHSVEHTWWDPRRSKWSTETLDGISRSLTGKNRNVGTAITGIPYPGNGIQLFYQNTDTHSVEHTWWDPRRSKWSTETLDGISRSLTGKNRNVGVAISGLMYNNNIQLFYHDAVAGELIHTWWDSRKSTWKTERMDGDTNTVLGNYINSGKKIDVATFKDKIFVAYYDDASVFSGDKKSSWRLIYWSGSTWIQNIVEGGGTGISNPTKSMPLADASLTPYGNSSVQMFYKGADSQLRHAWIGK